MKNFRRKPFPIEEAIALREKGMSYRKIGRQLGFSLTSVLHNLNKHYREWRLEYQKTWVKNQGEEYRQKIKKYARDWQREYSQERYWNDELFRERVKEASKKSNKKTYDVRVKDGLCVECGAPKDSERRMCFSCREKRNAYFRAYRKRLKELKDEKGVNL